MAPRPPLDVAAFGVSTPFAYWGFAAVLEAMRALAGDTRHLHVTGLAQLREGVEAGGEASVAITADLPDPDLAAFVAQAQLPLVVFADRVETMIDWAAHSRNLRRAAATRFVSQVLSALAPAFLAPHALILGPGLGPTQVFGAAVGRLFPDLGERQAEALLRRLGAEGKIRADGPERWTPPPVADGAAAAAENAAIASYAVMFAGRPLTRIDWPLSLFYGPDAAPWRGPVDLTGPARAVLYGPYMHLPVGRWIARVEFEIDGAVSGVEAMADVVASEVVVRKSFDMPARGIFAYELDFEIADPRRAVEIRLLTRRSAIEGRLLVRSVAVRAGEG